jgi:hypothetical protein
MQWTPTRTPRNPPEHRTAPRTAATDASPPPNAQPTPRSATPTHPPTNDSSGRPESAGSSTQEPESTSADGESVTTTTMKLAEPTDKFGSRWIRSSRRRSNRSTARKTDQLRSPVGDGTVRPAAVPVPNLEKRTRTYSSRTTTGTCWIVLLANPPRFQGCSVG